DQVDPLSRPARIQVWAEARERARERQLPRVDLAVREHFGLPVGRHHVAVDPPAPGDLELMEAPAAADTAQGHQARVVLGRGQRPVAGGEGVPQLWTTG